MWDDFSIGDVGKHAGAATVVGNLSINTTAYWWFDNELDIGGKIAKDTREGKAITALVESGITKERIHDLLLKIAVTALSPNKIVDLIARARNVGFKAGGENRASAIREALGIVAE